MTTIQPSTRATHLAIVEGKPRAGCYESTLLIGILALLLTLLSLQPFVVGHIAPLTDYIAAGFMAAAGAA